MGDSIRQMYDDDLLRASVVNGKEVYHISTPCRFHIRQSVVNALRATYLPDEEVGGFLWVRPAKVDAEIVYFVDQVSFVRNAIEDNPYKDKAGRLRIKKDTYWPDLKEYSDELSKISLKNCLPVQFHTHPTQGTDISDSLRCMDFQMETSEQDISESGRAVVIGQYELLMPRALIVGNATYGQDIFIGLYNGFVAPVNFGESKEMIQRLNVERIGDRLSSVNLNTGQKVMLGVGAALLLYAVWKYPKYSLPVIAALALTAPGFLTNTTSIENPYYFNRLSFGDVNIFLPER